MSDQPRLPNYKEWAMKEYWDPLEFGRLAVGLTGYAHYDANSATLNHDANARAEELAQSALRSIHANTLKDRPTPREWLAWAQARDIEVPAGLQAAVAEHEPPPAIHERPKSMSAQTKEKETLLRIVGGLAKAGYRVDLGFPHAAAQEIVTELQGVGVDIAKDTVAKYLKMAGELIGKKSPKDQ